MIILPVNLFLSWFVRAGLALHHREPIDAHWSGAFVKAVLGYPIVPRVIRPDSYLNYA